MSNASYSVISKKKIGSFNKTIQGKLLSDKSISIRAFLIGSISQGISTVKNTLESDDVFSAITVCRKLGVKIKKIKSGHYHIYGKGLGSFFAKKNTTLNCGNSGTLFRLLVGILSTTPNINLKITGDRSLKKRNMSNLINLMNKFGANFQKKSYLPISMVSSSMPLGINYKAGVSAQLKSAVILAGLNSYGTTTIEEIKKNQSRNHTENLLQESQGVLRVKKDKIKVFGKKSLEPINLTVPGDPSSAAFFCAITLFNKNSNLKIKNICLNSRRIGFYKLLKKHGARIKFKNVKKNFNDVTGDIHIQSGGKIKPIKANSSYYPSTADEYVILAVCAAMIPGTSIFNGIEDLSNKESSRAHEMKKILGQIGIKCKLSKNKMKIFGSKNIKIKNKIIRVSNLLDHRICMATICLSLLTGVKSIVKNFETVDTSSPSFLKIIKSIGGKYEIKKK